MALAFVSAALALAASPWKTEPGVNPAERLVCPANGANVAGADPVDAAVPEWRIVNQAASPFDGFQDHSSYGESVREHHALVYDAARDQLFYVNVDDGAYPEAWRWDGGTWRRFRTSMRVGTLSPAMAYDSARERVVRVGCERLLDPRSDDPILFDPHTWEWDGRAWTEVVPSASFTPRERTAVAYDAARGRVVLFGGYTSYSHWDGYFASADTWEWDGATWVRRTPPTSPPARFGHAMAYDSARQRVVMFGGFSSDSGVFGDTWEWDGTTWTDVTPPHGPEARYLPSMAYDAARERVVLFGGASWGDFLADTWEWDGTSWVDVTSEGGPPKRRGGAMAYDARRQRIVLYAGMNWDLDRGLADTWEWDGATWTDVSPPTVGPPRWATYSLAFDRNRGRAVLVGTLWAYSLGRFTQTWEWDGDTWIDRQPGTGPPDDWTMLCLAHDDARGRTVLVGTRPPFASSETWEWDGNGWEEPAFAAGPTGWCKAAAYNAARGRVVAVVSDPYVRPPYDRPLQLWEWDGVSWSRILSSTGPRYRDGPAVTYDRARDRLVLFGGHVWVDTPGYWASTDETWEWDGSSWDQRAPTVRPPARAGAAMIYDDARGRSVLHRGYGGPGWSNPLPDTWEWDGNAWTETASGNAAPIAFSSGMTHDTVHDRELVFEPYTGDTWTYAPLDVCGSASSVITYSPGAGTDATSPEAALGTRDEVSVSLGTGGSVVLEAIPLIRDDAGTDLVVYEDGARDGEVDERFFVEVSDDNHRFESAADCSGGKCLVDLAWTGLRQARFVRITDVAPQEAGTSPPRLGADIDAMASLHCCPDRFPPSVAILARPRASSFPRLLPFNELFVDEDGDGDAGGIIHEVVTLDGCVLYDGLTYGDGDGLLLDENAPATADEMCRLVRLCGKRLWQNPVLAVTATDCGGSAATASSVLPGSVLIPASRCP